MSLKPDGLTSGEQHRSRADAEESSGDNRAAAADEATAAAGVDATAVANGEAAAGPLSGDSRHPFGVAIPLPLKLSLCLCRLLTDARNVNRTQAGVKAAEEALLHWNVTWQDDGSR